MKKLMTTLSAIAVAIGLQAVGVAETGTSFEGLSAGDYEITNQEGELSPQLGGTYWVTNGTQVLKVVNGLSLEDYFPSGIPQRPDIYMDNSSSQTNYLSIKTTLGSPAIRNLNADGTAADIGSGYYFDSLVKFTAFDVENEASAVVTNNGKLAIWLKEVLVEQDGEERPTATNLIVTAGFIDEDEPNGYRAVPMNYSCKVSGDTAGTYLCDGAWHRVTVRAINSIYKSGQTVTPGFAVFIDGNLVTCRNQAKGIDSTKLDPKLAAFDAVGAVFPSADQYTGKKAKIESVSFDGQGDVDDLVFTTTAPSFAEDKDVFTVALGEGVASASFVDGNGNEWSNVDSTTLVDWEAGLKIRVTSITAADGYTVFGYDADDYKDVIIDPDNLIDEDEGFWYKTTAAGQIITLTAKPATIKVGSEWFETLSDAFGYVNDQVAGGDFTVELTAVATDGFVLNNANATVTLDLAGNDITNATKSAAVVLQSGSLLITNSTPETVGHVVAMTEGGDAVLASGGELAIAGGKYDGFVFYDYVGVPPFEITDGEFAAVNGEDSDVLDQLVTAVKEGLGDDYTLSLDGDYYVIAEDTGWTVTFMDGESEYDSQKVEDGEFAVVPDAPTKDGYEFNGWYEEGAAVPFNFATAITNNLTLYADWTLETYNITYNLDLEGATNAVANVSTYTYNDAVVILPAGCIGYTFNGWTNSEGQVVSAIALHSKDDVTLYASWAIKSYAVSFDSNGGSYAPEGQMVPYGSYATKPSPDPTKDGCVFTGWFAAGSETAFDFANTPITEALALTAAWTVLPPSEKHPAGEDFNPPAGKTAAEFAAEINSGSAAIADYLVIPSGVSSSTDYCALFMATNVGEKVEFVLNEAAEAAAEADANAAAATIVATPGTVPSTLTIDAEPGLYYSISYGSTLTSMAEGARTLATDAILTDGKITLDMPQQSLGATSGFYQVNVNIADKPSQD